MSRWSMRTVILLGSPLLMAVSSVIHPHPPFREPGMLEFLRTRLSIWMGVHLAQLLLVFLLGLALWLLTEGLASRAATASRIATALFLVFYASFDSVVGIGTGLLAQVVGADPAMEPSVAAGLVDRYWLARFELPIGPLIGVADLAWLAAVTAAAVALRARGASRSTLVLLMVAAVSFAIDHPSPTGTIGMLALFAANVLLHRDGLLTSTQRIRSGGALPAQAALLLVAIVMAAPPAADAASQALPDGWARVWISPATEMPSFCLKLHEGGDAEFVEGFRWLNPVSWSRDPASGELSLTFASLDPTSSANLKAASEAGHIAGFDGKARVARYRIGPETRYLDFAGYMLFRPEALVPHEFDSIPKGCWSGPPPKGAAGEAE